jgi:hypothetical protein
VKNILGFLLLLAVFAFDFVFFNYEISNVIKARAGYAKIMDKYVTENEYYFPLYIPSNKMEISDCSQLPRIRKDITFLNVFNNDDLKFVEKNCRIISILRSARNLKKSFIDNIELVDFSKWNGDMVFGYSCEQKNSLAFAEDFDKISLQKLKERGAVEYYTTNSKKELIIKDLLNDRLLRVKEVARGNFDDNDYMEILLEIAIADKGNNFIECYKLDNFSRESGKGLMHRI